ncbi:MULTISPECIES: DUF4183 domain-containing protein [Lysinibacillus]|uniref:DUF4183 domain-containing protein n=1 Tax=Lysinibacillus TaxID=400634 RepID=UPI0005684E1A|nr:DUF4183 domain-containing protein [Lysinibacillus sphaericus]MBG9758009.1 hypothetical protein [Lysinibacillus sphaericus]MEB7452796.1 DUF4183 domain-containing protein [Lysinibacillus sphaericus]QPA55901.1 DUF4183 domain-containing protein [Lysinibacillus sphaericus]QTB15071.1 DUF4183 domain-containing protein [Lysinibacillus sphaericus]QTB23960.1 DUF4183 domain-containing protein [Lysinibacillus sphaericus]
MVNPKHGRINNGSCDCSNEEQFIWPRIKATNGPIVPPIEIVPEGIIIPTINRYFYILTSDLDLTNGATLPATLFWNDHTDPITEFVIFSPNGYVNLYINAVMQEGGIYTISDTALTITPYNGTLFRGTPIIIESLGFTMK